MKTLKKRTDFLKVKRGRRWTTPSLILQGLPRSGISAEKPGDVDEETPRFGFIITKRIGNAVQRNLIKRRLREAVRNTQPRLAASGFDYVIVARQGTKDRSFDEIMSDLQKAFAEVNKNNGRASGNRSMKQTEDKG